MRKFALVVFYLKLGRLTDRRRDVCGFFNILGEKTPPARVRYRWWGFDFPSNWEITLLDSRSVSLQRVCQSVTMRLILSVKVCR